MLKELKVLVIALVATSIVTILAIISAALAKIQVWKLMVDKDDIIGEVPSKVMTITFWFTGLFQEVIMKIS